MTDTLAIVCGRIWALLCRMPLSKTLARATGEKTRLRIRRYVSRANLRHPNHVLHHLLSE